MAAAAIVIFFLLSPQLAASGQELAEPPLSTPAATLATSTPPITKELSPRELIKFYADKYGVNHKHAEAIAECENDTFDPSRKNPRSSATGIFQWLRGSWEYYGAQKWGSIQGHARTNAADNIELAIWVMSKRGYTDWAASSYCWKPKIAIIK